MDKNLKTCNKCHIEQNISMYHRDKSKKDGYKNYCKLCQKSYSEKYYQDNAAELKEYSLNRYRNLSDDESFILNIKEIEKKYRANNPEKVKLKQKKYYLKNKEKLCNYASEYRKNNKHIRVEYTEKNRERINRVSNEWAKNKLKTDPLFKLSSNIRRLIAISVKKSGFVKKSKSIEILGCSFSEFKQHLESKFEPWMTWENHGKYNSELNYGWDIDHIIPVSYAITEEDILRLNHYTNFQPLDSYKNRVLKRDKLIYG